MADALLRRLMILQRVPEYPRKTSTRQLLSLLQGEGISCSIRTIQRDLEYLSSSGLFGIGSDMDSKPIGWYWMAGTKGKGYNCLDRSSAVAFALMEPLLQGKLPSSVMEKLNEYFQQAEKFLHNDHGWTRKVYVSKEETMPQRDLDNGSLDLICEAMDLDVCLSMDFGRYYKGIDLNYIHVDIVHPLALITLDKTPYLVHFKGEYRRVSLAPVHHLRNIQILDIPVCEEADTFDVNEYANRMSLQKVYKKDVKFNLVVNIKTARYLKENPLAKTQKIILNDDGTCDVSFVSDDTNKLRTRLKSLDLLGSQTQS